MAKRSAAVGVALWLLFPALLSAVTINWGAANNGFALNNGTDLPVGNLVRMGVFHANATVLMSLQNNLTALNATFTELDATTIGANGEDAGLFEKKSASLNTGPSGLNLAGSQLAIWAFNSSAVGNATQHAIVYVDKAVNSTWALENGAGGGLDFASNNINLYDLTTNNTTLAAGATVVVGQFGSPNTFNNATGGADFRLYALPVSGNYTTWASSLPSGQQGQNDDPDHDFVPNKEEYAFGLNGNSSAAGNGTAAFRSKVFGTLYNNGTASTVADDFLRYQLQLPVPAPADVTYRVVGSSIPNDNPDSPTGGAGTVVLAAYSGATGNWTVGSPSGSNPYVISDTQKVGTAPRRFLYLNLTIAP